MKKLFYLIIISILNFNIAYSQSDTIETNKKVPTLNGHTFSSFGQLRSSFVNTSLKTNIGLGSTSTLKIPGIIIDDYELFAFEGKILFVDINLKYKQRFTPWLSLYFNLQLAGRLGTDMSTILADGVNSISGGKIGWLFRVLHNEKFNLATSVEVTNLSGSFINVSDYFNAIVNNDPHPSFIKNTPAMTVGIGLQGAYAFTPTFGFQFQGDFSYGESFEREHNKAYFTAAIVGDVDFKPNFNVPVNLGLGYTITSAPEILMNAEGVSNLFIGKISYSGSDDFDLGLQFTYFDLDLNSVEGKTYISKFSLLLQFYF